MKVTDYMKTMSACRQDLISEIIVQLKLYFVLACTDSANELSASTRRLTEN